MMEQLHLWVSTKRTESRDLNRFTVFKAVLFTIAKRRTQPLKQLPVSFHHTTFSRQPDMYVTSDPISTDIPWSHICIESTVTYFSNYSWSLERLHMRGQVHFLTFQRTMTSFPLGESHDLCCAHWRSGFTYLTVNLHVHPFNKESMLLNAGIQQRMLFCPPRTLPSDEIKVYLLTWLLEMSIGWGRDGKPAALSKSRTDVARESLPIFLYF